MNNSKTILALVFLMAGALLTIGTTTIMVPAAYAGGDDHDDDNGDGNKNKAEDESAAAIADCDGNEVEQAGFDCFGIAVNDIEVDLGSTVAGLTGLGSSEQAAAQFAGADGEEEEEEEEEEET
jgi:ribosomal protein L12E/L44/L45/RPP1/RPP2